MSVENFQDRLLGRVPEAPVTVDEVIDRLQAFRGDAEIEISRNMVMIRISKNKRVAGTCPPLGWLDEPVPVELRRNL